MISRSVLLGVLLALCAQNFKLASCKPMVGGFGEVQDADDTVQEILEKVQSEIEGKEDKEFEKFEAVKYSKQVVNGFNYLIKAETDDGYMHIQIYVKSEDVDPSLTGYESGKKLEDELVQVGKHRPVTLPAAIEPKPIHGHHGKHKPVPLPAMIGPKPKPGQPGKQKPVPPPFVGPKPGPGHSCCDCGELPPKRPLVGAFGETKDADDKVKEVLEKVRTTLEEKVGKSFDTFEAISFKTQVVAGTNYLIKVEYDDGYLHALVFEPLPHTEKDPELVSHEIGKSLEDELKPISSKPSYRSPPPPPPGAFGETKDADDEVITLLASLEEQIKDNLEEETEKFNAISYAKQIVSGTNYIIKVETDNGYLHVTIYKPPPLTKMATVVKKVETGKTLEEDLVPPMPCKCPRTMSTTRPGGFSEPREVDDEIQDVLKKIRDQVEEQQGKQFETFEAVKYARQTVAGTNFIIKVRTEDDYLHVHVFRPLPHVSDELELKACENGKTLEDLLLPLGNPEQPPMMLGGYSEPQPATQEVHDALELIQDDLEQREGKKFTTFKALSFISQVVAGTNFVIKVQTDDGYLHAHVFRPLPHVQEPTQLISYETGKTEEEILVPPPPPMMLGGYSEPRPATQEVRDVLELIQDEVEEQEGKTFTVFEARTFISQTVSGTNFVIKVQTDDDYLHVHVFRPLPHVQEPTQLITYEPEKTLEDVLMPIHFDTLPSSGMVGAYGEVMDADEEVAEILGSIQNELEEKEGKEFDTFKAHSYITQVVAGTNYRIKIETEDGYLHALVFKPLPPSDEGEPKPLLVKYKTDVKLEDSLYDWED